MPSHAEVKKILIIQTAFIGDTILATHFAVAVKSEFPDCEIHFLTRLGNESVLQGVPSISKVWKWDKSKGRYLSLLRLASEIRHNSYEYVFNLHRHASSGVFTALAKAKVKVGFRQNPLHFMFHDQADHRIPYIEEGRVLHETQRNLKLLKLVKPSFTIPLDPKLCRPTLGSLEAESLSAGRKIFSDWQDPQDYVVVAPASVWFTKAWSEDKFRELVAALSKRLKVVLVGSVQDAELCHRIAGTALDSQVFNAAGKLSLRETASLMAKARRVFVNDSSPLHLASAVNAPTTAIFCSTIPEFGYFPLADDSVVISVSSLECKPCGLHGHAECPLGHFRCSTDLSVKRVSETLKSL